MQSVVNTAKTEAQPLGTVVNCGVTGWEQYFQLQSGMNVIVTSFVL